MTDGDDLGGKAEYYSLIFNLWGDFAFIEKIVHFETPEFLIEEIKGEEEDYSTRRLIMKKNVTVIQSQFRVCLKNGTTEPPQKRFEKSFLKETADSVASIDEANLEFDYCK